MQRLDITIPSGAGHCAAWLHLPEGPGPHACVVIAHGIGAVRQVRLSAYAERFTAAGVAVLSFDYRHWGESSDTPRFVCSIGTQHQDIRCALDVAQRLPQIDPSRVFLFGTSFGGGHALVVGAQRPELAGVISQCTVSDCLVVATRSPLRQILKWVGSGTIDQVKALLGLQPHYIKLAGEPGEAALMTKLDAERRYREMLDGPSRWENKIAARLMLWLPLYRPIRSARSIQSPLLMIVCDKDEICPASIAKRVADLAPRGEAVHFDSSHFDIYFGQLFEAAVKTMLEFIHRQSPMNPSTGKVN